MSLEKTKEKSGNPKLRNPKKPVRLTEEVRIGKDPWRIDKDWTDEEYKKLYGVDRPTHYTKIIYEPKYELDT